MRSERGGRGLPARHGTTPRQLVQRMGPLACGARHGHARSVSACPNHITKCARCRAQLRCLSCAMVGTVGRDPGYCNACSPLQPAASRARRAAPVPPAVRAVPRASSLAGDSAHDAVMARMTERIARGLDRADSAPRPAAPQAPRIVPAAARIARRPLAPWAAPRRCAYCHGPADGAISCASCGTLVHEDCLALSRRGCTTYGCAGRYSLPGSTSASAPPAPTAPPTPTTPPAIATAPAHTTPPAIATAPAASAAAPAPRPGYGTYSSEPIPGACECCGATADRSSVSRCPRNGCCGLIVHPSCAGARRCESCRAALIPLVAPATAPAFTPSAPAAIPRVVSQPSLSQVSSPLVRSAPTDEASDGIRSLTDDQVRERLLNYVARPSWGDYAGGALVGSWCLSIGLSLLLAIGGSHGSGRSQGEHNIVALSFFLFGPLLGVIYVALRKPTHKLPSLAGRPLRDHYRRTLREAQRR